jgi:hypothetical protein
LFPLDHVSSVRLASTPVPSPQYFPRCDQLLNHLRAWLSLDSTIRVHLTIKPLDTIRAEKGEIPAKLFEFLWAKDILLRFFRSAIHAKSILQCSPFVRHAFSRQKSLMSSGRSLKGLLRLRGKEQRADRNLIEFLSFTSSTRLCGHGFCQRASGQQPARGVAVRPPDCVAPWAAESRFSSQGSGSLESVLDRASVPVASTVYLVKHQRSADLLDVDIPGVPCGRRIGSLTQIKRAVDYSRTRSAVRARGTN